MRIGFDAKRLFNNFTGLGNYSRTLVSELRKLDSENELYLFLPKAEANERTETFFSSDYKIITPPASYPKFLRSYWRTGQIGRSAKKLGIELFHGLSSELPSDLEKTGIPSVVTVHDLIYLRFPHYYPALQRKIYAQKTAIACKSAKRVVAISQRTADDLMELMNVPASKIEVIYQGCDPIFDRISGEEERLSVKTKYGILRPCILSVGSIEERKNQLTLVKAYLETGLFKTHDLVLVGKAGKYQKSIEETLNNNPEAKDSVNIINDLDFSDLPTLYQMSQISVYPSRYEGFGIPILEALKSKTPVIAASGSCLAEVGGEAALYFGPDDVKTLGEHLKLLAENPQTCEELSILGVQQSKKFSNQIMASNYLELYHSML